MQAPTTQEHMQVNQTLGQQGPPQQPQMIVQHPQQTPTSQPYPMVQPINVHIGGTQGRFRGCLMRSCWQGRRQP